MMFDETYRSRRVLVTGHTGFKGSWLGAWLTKIGAVVAGYANGVPTTPSHFEAISLGNRVAHYPGDIRNRAHLAAAIDDFAPEMVFHLAAQALVRRSYAEPVETFETNAIGTLNLLEVARTRPGIRAIILITSDKAYRNVEWPWGYRENDTLGGDDPYSGSKACAELIAHSYAKSYFPSDGPLAVVATTRAGNVIGGGDWAADRIVPDCVRAWSTANPVRLRHPQATRPWQHVLEPLSGYLALGSRLWQRTVESGSAYNFGPDATVNQPVAALIESMGQRWPDARWEPEPGVKDAVREATLLKLCCDRALAELQWRPVLSFAECVQFTVDWYRDYYADPTGAASRTLAQIRDYERLAGERGLGWAQ
jgi:CDP-glucose 4,6-dehydratase